MTGVYLHYFWLFFTLIFGLVEFFFFNYFLNYNINILKNFKNNFKSILDFNLLNFNLLNFNLLAHTVAYISFKVYTQMFTLSINFFNVFLLVFLVYFFILIKFSTLDTAKYFWIIINVYLLIYLYAVVLDFITLLLILETITTLYYFFFLQHSKSSNYSLIKYKNLISQYLWLSFFTLIFFMLNIFIFIFIFGTLNFNELISLNINKTYFFFLIIAFFWKLGLPLFHFFKLELYQFLNFPSLVLFSTLTLVSNSFLFIYTIFLLNTIVSLSNFLIFLIFMFNLIFLIQGLEKIQIFYFFALSSINTWVFFLLLALL